MEQLTGEVIAVIAGIIMLLLLWCAYMIGKETGERRQAAQHQYEQTLLQNRVNQLQWELDNAEMSDHSKLADSYMKTALQVTDDIRNKITARAQAIAGLSNLVDDGSDHDPEGR